ncbi:MAG: RagB/SusD family nutrient uptake outer membrane protein [Bacteroidales bacterium]|nr:RagB/SusD family nutrient uptake outer membrane protein [Bacteroidales bacterium]
MKKTIINTLLIFAALVASSSCIKETFPEGSTVTSSQVAASSGALEAMLNSIPASMVTTGTAGYLSKYSHHGDFGIGEIHLITENMLEDFCTLADNPYYNRNYYWGMCYAQGPTSWPCAYFWDCYYPWIKTCNDIISSILAGGEPTATTAIILGKAYAYRASFYLDLARLYEPKENKYTDVSNVLGLTVPIINEKTTEAEAKNNPRATHEKMYEFILEDLTNAEKYLADAPKAKNEPGLDAVHGLMARLYLEEGAAGVEGAYAKAYEYADMVINSATGYSPLTQAQWEDPVNGFNNMASQNSWIWGIGITAENFNNICTYAAFICSEGQWGYAPLVQLGADKNFYESISDSDWRKHSWLDPAFLDYYNYKFSGSEKDGYDFLHGNDNVGPAKAYESIKFRPAGGDTQENTVGNATDQPLMRVEEMYFIAAEALAQQNNKLGEAKAMLEKLIVTRNPNYTCKANSTAEFLEEMLLQKRIEFWGEGILMYDYKRLDHGITRGYKGTLWPADFCFNSEGRSPQWNIVITRAEIQANNGISEEQNNPDPSNFTPLWVDKD